MVWLAGLLAALACAFAAGEARAAGRVLVLSAADETAYRAAFDATDARDWAAADAALAQTHDGVLVGAVLARRYLSGAYRPDYGDLADWLARENDSAFADRVYARAMALRPRSARAPTPPVPAGRRPIPLAGSAPPGDSAAARQRLEEAAQLAAAGDAEGAVAAAREAADGPRAGQAEFLLGVLAFRARAYAQAAAHFDAAVAWRHWDALGAAGARYWAGRAHLAAGDARGALTRFKAALAYPATFYGQLAEAQLGVGSGLDFTPPTIGPEEALDFMRRHREARRAAALAQVGRLSDVENELRLLHTRLKPEEDRVFLDFADALSAPSAQLRAAEFGSAREGWGYCPTTTFAPENGWRMDRAAVFAIARQESRYSPIAVSTSNARGLMQLLPSTASDMDPGKPFRARPDLLNEPGLNLRLGQAYLEFLFRQAAPDGDLVKLFAAYNGGPGWLSRWLAANPDLKDPLLILELLPRAESRDYAERVLANMALCRKRFGQEAVEFDELASGKAAKYLRQDR
ncbi:MAG: transglycosylase SLT domain-containing protein [Hyphomonadaceae bacterium]